MSDHELLLADGFDAAILGVAEGLGRPRCVVYDRDACVQILIAKGMTAEEAEEFFSFNVEGAWVGEHTPLFVRRCTRDELED